MRISATHGRTRLVPFLFLAAGTLWLSSCGSTNPPPDPAGKQPYVIPDSLLKTLTIDSVHKGELINAITLTGQVDFNQDKEVNIYPLVSGNINGVTVELGNYVHAGDRLGVVRSSEMAGYTNNLIVAQTNVTATKRQLDATEDLFKSGLASNLDVTTAQVNYDQAVAQLTMAQRILKINGNDTAGVYVVRSPVDGFVVQKFVTNAQAIRPDNGNAMFTISDLKDVWVWANVYESDLAQVHLGDQVDVTTLSYPGRVFKGRIDKIMHVLDPATKVTKIRVVIDNPDFALRPQMFASVLLTNTQHQQALYVSSGAMVFDHSQYYVLLYHGSGKADITPVQKLNALGNKVYLVNDGSVKEGDQVIASGTLQIYDELNN